MNAALLLALLLQAPPADTLVVIRGATVIPMTGSTPEVLRDHSVVIRNGVIARVAHDSAVGVDGARVVEGAGTFLMPGLADMHAHVQRADLPLYLANGVTTVREMNGSPTLLALRDDVRRGAVAGPRMFVGTPLLTGTAIREFRHVVVPDADSARALAPLIDAYDFVKIYDDLTAGAYAELVRLGRSRGVRVTGHIPVAVGLQGVLGAKQDLEHIEKMVWATVGHQLDTTRMPVADIIGQVARAGVWLTPTLYSQRVLTLQGTAAFEALFERPELRYVSDGIAGWWQSMRRSSGEPRALDPNSRGERLHRFQQRLVRALHEAGVPMLLGTDTPNPLVIPGFSIHDEIDALVNAGVPLYDVLRSGTARAGEYMQRERFGVIEPGAVADIVLLAANPLETPSTLRRPLLVIAGGRVYERAELDRLIAR